MNLPEWFMIREGRYAGRWHISGWMASAIKGERTGVRNDGWLTWSVCPVCFAMVLSDDAHAYGDQTWAHEEWHARTDFPRPSPAP